MKKTLIIALALLLCGSAFAQEETPAKFKLYGFIRNYGVMDTRSVKGGTHDLYYYMPEDISLNEAKEDLNGMSNWKFVSLTTRLGLDVSGYQFGSMNISGKVEADFYSLNGTGAANTIAQFRLRQAYMALAWKYSDANSLTLNLGQTWHPMGADLPNCINLESGAPFGPFNRSPQAMLHFKSNFFTLTGGMLYLSQYLPMDYETGGKSVNPFRYGMPEAFLGVAFNLGPVVLKSGASMLNTKPIRTYNGKKANGTMSALSEYVYVQYTKGLFQLKYKAALAMSGEHLNILSGYGVSKYDQATNTFTYTPMQDFCTWLSFQYGKKVQVMGMAGYMKQLGTTEELADGFKVLLNSAASQNIQQAFRLTPTIVWNLGKFSVGLEYDMTSAEFGNTLASGTAKEADAVRNSFGVYEAGQTHWVTNHRILCMTKFNF